jgi:ABC-type multidrug transport system ATPase subunit
MIQGIRHGGGEKQILRHNDVEHLEEKLKKYPRGTPKIIVFDEPLVGLDPHAIKELKEVFRELKAGGASLLISTHMLDSVEDYWDVAHIMVKGSFAATKVNDPGDTEMSLEELFFSITEGKEGES